MHTTTGGRALETRLARSLCGSVLCSKRESSSPFISISQNALRNRIAAAEVDPPKQQFGYFDVFYVHQPAYTTFRPINVKLNQQRFCHCHDKGVVRMIPTTHHSLYVEYEVSFLCSQNRIHQSVGIEDPKPLLTVFDVHHRLEDCPLPPTSTEIEFSKIFYVLIAKVVFTRKSKTAPVNEQIT